MSFQELATRVSHRNTGRFTDDPMCEQLLARVAADENLHMVFYRNLLDAALKVAPDQTVMAVRDVVKEFQMPGTDIPGFQRKAVEMAVAGIYDLRLHKDDVLSPVLRFWKLFELENLSAEAEQARLELDEFMENLEKQALRFEDKRETLKAPWHSSAEPSGAALSPSAAPPGGGGAVMTPSGSPGHGENSHSPVACSCGPSGLSPLSSGAPHQRFTRQAADEVPRHPPQVRRRDDPSGLLMTAHGLPTCSSGPNIRSSNVRTSRSKPTTPPKVPSRQGAV